MCMACLDPLDLPRLDVCAEYKSAVECLETADPTNQCFLEPRLALLKQDYDEIFFDAGPYCPQGACDFNAAIACVDGFLQGRAGPFCGEIGNIRSCFQTQGCDPDPFLNAPVNQMPNRFGPCGPPPIPPECSPLSVFRGPLNLSTFSGWANGNCDLQLNTPDCLFDAGECCLEAGDVCIDPGGGPFFSSAAENCFNTCIVPNRIEDGFCQWFTDVPSCLVAQGCALVNVEFAEILAFDATLASVACAEPSCLADEAYACIVEELKTEITAANCPQQRTAAEQCFTGNGCSSSVANALFTLVPEFSICADNSTGTIPPACTQLSVFPARAPDFAGWQDARCSIELNTPECNFDDGKVFRL